MQNSSSGVDAGNVPVAVKSRTPEKLPSWKIHTSAPNTALRLSTLRISALTGTTTLPNIRNSSTKVASATRPSAIGRRAKIDSFESTSSADGPVTRTGNGARVSRTALARRSPASEYGSTDGTTESQVASSA